MAGWTEAETALRRIRDRLGRRAGVRGIGVTLDAQGGACVRINVDPAAYEEIDRLVQEERQDVPVVLRRVGPLRAFGSPA